MYIIHVFKKHLFYPWALENRKHYLVNNLGAFSIFEKCKCVRKFLSDNYLGIQFFNNKCLVSLLYTYLQNTTDNIHLVKRKL